MRYLVRLSVPRAGGWRAWGTVRDEFGRQLAEQESAATLYVDSEIRRGRDYVRVVILATVDADDVAEALDLAWWAFRKAAGEDLAGWALSGAEAEVRPERRQQPRGLLRGDQRGDDAPRDGAAAAGYRVAVSAGAARSHSRRVMRPVKMCMTVLVAAVP